MIIMKHSLRSFPVTLLASATLLLALPSQNLLAQCSASGDPFGGGDGTSGSPFQICSIDQLNRIRNNSGGENYLDDHFVLTTDLDFTDYNYMRGTRAENEKGWLPIGTDASNFTGSFDGANHVIRKLAMNRPGESFSGLFGILGFSGVVSVKNLGLEGLNIIAGNATGGLVGSNRGTITSCYSTGEVVGGNVVGGLAGRSNEGGVITSSYSTASATASGHSVGGFVGTNNLGTIISCYSTGFVSGGTSNVGGFAGSIGGVDGKVSSCYSTGEVTGSSRVGGFIGLNEQAISSCYSTGAVTGTSGVGGFVGSQHSTATMSMSFWDTETSDRDTSAGGSGATGKTTDEMQALDEDDFGADSELSWHFGADTQYPALRTHEEMPAGTQVQGRLICGQPIDHFQCPALSFGSETIAAQTYPSETMASLVLPVPEEAGTGTLTYTLTPALPAGLSFVAEIRTLSGTPSAASPVATYTYTVTDFAAPPQTATLTFTITVIDPGAPVFSVTTIADRTYTENTEIDDMVLPEATGGTGMLTYALPVELPTGLAFEPATRALSGTPTEPQAATAYNYTVTDSATSPLTTTLIVMITVLADTTAPDFAGATINDQTYTKDTAITDLVLPPATDTGIVTYSLSPALPSGLIPAGAVTNLADPPTISGMPDTTSATMTYTYTAKDNATTPNAQTLTFTITVDDLPLVSISGGDSVTEGVPAEFTLTRTGDTTAALTVMVTVSGDAGFLPSAVSVEVGGSAVSPTVAGGDSFMVMIAASATKVVFVVATEGDDGDEEDGEITATIAESASTYRLGTSIAMVAVMDDDLVPPAPADLAASTADATSVSLTWTAVTAVPPITGYQVQVSSVAVGAMGVTTAWTDIMNSDASTASHRVTSLTAETAYTFEIRAQNAAGDGEVATIDATTAAVEPPGTPTALMAGTPTSTTVPLTWTVATTGGDATAFQFNVSNADGSEIITDWTDIMNSDATTASYTVTGLTAETSYTFALRAKNSAGESAEVTVTATTKAASATLSFGGETIDDQTYTKDTAITDLVLPVATGGTGPYTYTLTPVPAGLMFNDDPASRTLSGTPTAITDTATTHTYTVTDSTTDTTLTKTLTFMITVNAAGTFGIGGSQGAGVHVYPNPAGDVLHIEFSGAGDYGIALLTLTGQQVFGGQHAGGGTRKLDVSTLKGGVYFLKIEDSEGGSHIVRILR